MVKKNLGIGLVELSVALGVIALLAIAGVDLMERARFNKELAIYIKDANNIIKRQSANNANRGVWEIVPNNGDTDCDPALVGNRVDPLFNINLWEDVCFTNNEGVLGVRFDPPEHIEVNERFVRAFGSQMNAVANAEGNFLTDNVINVRVDIPGRSSIVQGALRALIDTEGNNEAQRVCFNNPGGGAPTCINANDILGFQNLEMLIGTCTTEIVAVNGELTCLNEEGGDGNGIGNEIVEEDEDEAGTCVVGRGWEGCSGGYVEGDVVPHESQCLMSTGEHGPNMVICINGSWSGETISGSGCIVGRHWENTGHGCIPGQRVPIGTMCFDVSVSPEMGPTGWEYMCTIAGWDKRRKIN